MNSISNEQRLSAIKAIQGWLKDEERDTRELVERTYLGYYAASGARSFEVRNPDGEKIATISVTIGDDRTETAPDWTAIYRHIEETGEVPDGVAPVEYGIVDASAFAAWCAGNPGFTREETTAGRNGIRVTLDKAFKAGVSERLSSAMPALMGGAE